MVTSIHTKKPAQWLALYFPHLALDQLDRSGQHDTPLAISDQQAGRRCIIDHNQAAQDLGIHIGMPAGTALNLADSLQLTARNQDAEQTSLERIAAWCYQYSSQVCIVPQRNGLLLEVAASRHLFGVVETLAERIDKELEQLGYHALSGSAPTPEAAHLAARHGLHIHTSDAIRKSIGALSIDTLQLQVTQLQTLKKTGFRTVAEVFRLPRKALTRRLGPAVSNYLDRLLGQCPDPCKSFHPAGSFSTGMDLPETAHTQGLVFPLKRLVQELCGVLRARDRGIQTLQIHLQLAVEATSISLTLRQITRSESHLMTLLRDRLERLQLPQPVRHIQLVAASFLPFAATQEDLLSETGLPSTDAANAVIEHLQARLGENAVKGLKGREDYRPEHSWSLRELDETATCTELPQRPTWLLAKPQACRIDTYHILAGPERIETGWWDGEDCRRDYFVVRDPDGSTLWAFHEYKPRPGWYLHGLFA